MADLAKKFGGGSKITAQVTGGGGKTIRCPSVHPPYLPEKVKAKGRLVDMSDLESDPLLAFQKRFYVPLVLFSLFVAPAAAPHFLWGEAWANAFFVAGTLR